MRLEPEWAFVSDQVMGGISDGRVIFEGDIATLTGSVSLENNGGFIQMAFDLSEDGEAQDLSDWTGFAMEVLGNGQNYEIRVRTSQLSRPWQSFKYEFATKPEWKSLLVPFADLKPHRTEAVFDPAKTRRIGILAIGAAFDAEISVANLRLYDEP